MLLYFVFRKIPFAEVWTLVKKSKVILLILAFLAFILSQILSSQRLLQYFHSQKFFLKSADNYKLYVIGMFYNFFIPGGIGGDAYKVFLLNRNFGWGVKKLSASVLADRLSGLLAIILLVLVFSFSFFKGFWQFAPFVAAVLVLVIARILMFRFFPAYKHIFYKALMYSFGVQLLQVVCLFFILQAFSPVHDFRIYFIIFLMSSVLSILSFSGIGVREWIFMKSAQYFDFDSGISVSAALMFSFLTVLVSVFGIYFQIRGIRFSQPSVE